MFIRVLTSILLLHDRSVSDGYCGFTHEGWYRTNEQHSPYGPSGDHTNGTSKYILNVIVHIYCYWLIDSAAGHNFSMLKKHD